MPWPCGCDWLPHGHGLGGHAQVVGAVRCRRAADAQSRNTATVAAAAAAAAAMSVICQPGMPPAMVVVVVVVCACGGACTVPPWPPGGGTCSANAAGDAAVNASKAPASPATMPARRWMGVDAGHGDLPRDRCWRPNARRERLQSG